MSGLLGELLGGGQRGGNVGAIVGVLQRVLSSNGGGIASVISRFESAGLGDQARSWVSSDANQPIAPEHIDQVFSQEEISGWASQAGTTPEKMRTILAEALPQAVDHATPNGQTPAPDSTPDLGSLVGNLFGKRF
jgi:uncharacterized protein YidB (DUF937 family)